MKKQLWWMNILDKENISNNKFCPPHYIPHKLPFGKKITNEKCHIHKAKWRMKHHTIFCKILKCPHYKFMMKTNLDKLKKNKL